MAAFENIHVYRGPVEGEADCMTRYFRVYPLPGEKTGGEKRSPGRPRVFNKMQRKIVAAAMRKYGLTKGIAFLAKERNLKVSITLCRSVAKEEGITFTLGRPAKAA